jgi:hypothetical protein
LGASGQGEFGTGFVDGHGAAAPLFVEVVVPVEAWPGTGPQTEELSTADGAAGCAAGCAGG